MMRKLTATILATSMALGNCANIYAEDTNKNNTNTNIVSKSNTVNNEKNESTTIITTTAQVKLEKATEVTTEATTEEKKKVEVITEKAVQTTTEAVTEATTKVTTEAVTETTTEAAKEETTQAATEAAKEETTQAATEAVKEETTEATTEAVKEETTEIVTEGNKEASSEATTASSELKKLADAPTEATTAEPATATETTTKKYYYSSSSSDSGLFEINKEETLYLDLNETVDLSKYVSNLISIEDYEWNTGNKKIVEVSSDGVIKGVSSGKTTVSAYYYSGEYYFQYIFTVNVDNEDVTAEKEFTIYVDATKDLGQFISKVAEPFEYDWSCDNKSIATVSNKGVVTGKKQGTTKINAKYHNGRYDYNYVFKITVKDTSGVSANTATISEKNVWSLYMPVGDGIYLEDFLTRNYNDYKWKISDEDVVEFKNGKLSGLKEGKTTVTATYGSKVITFNLMINNKYEIVEADIKVKTSLDIRGCLDEDVSKYEITSDREPVVTVGENAVLTGHNAGMATVLAKGSKGKIIQVVCTVANTGATKLGSKITSNGRVDVRTYTNAYKENPTTPAVKEENEQEEANSASNAVFDDIAHRTWAVASIENMAKKGYLVGVGDGRFNPDGTTKRADFTIVLVKMAGLEGQSEDLYEDVRGNEYYADYVRTAKYNGIEGGVSENCFRPKDAITREEIFVMIYKALKLKGVDMDTNTGVLDKYADNSYINDDNREAIAALVNMGIVVGTGDELEITNYITRAQMAVLLDNIDEYFE